MILDGYGLRENAEGNAITSAKTPNLDKLFQAILIPGLLPLACQWDYPRGRWATQRSGTLI